MTAARVGAGLVAALVALVAALGWLAAPAGAAGATVPAPTVTATGAAPALGAPTGPLARPVVGAAATPTGGGYWLVASDGGIFSFGDATFHGAATGLPAGDRAIAITGWRGGYVVATAHGRLPSFGPAPAVPAPAPTAAGHAVSAVAIRPDGTGAWLVRQPAPVAAPSTPAPPAGSGSGRRIVYDGTANRVWLVRADETVERTYLVSGRRGTPAAGTYRVFSKSPLAWAGHDGITMRHMVRFAHGSDLAIGFHAIPLDRHGRPLQTEAQLGTYRSDGCVRQRASDAAYLYDWAPVGTTVVVVR